MRWINNMSLRLRVSFATASLLAAACILLTFIVNLQAMQMAERIKAAPLNPAAPVVNQGAAESPGLPDITEELADSSRDHLYAQRQFKIESLIAMLAVSIGGGALAYIITWRALLPLNTLAHKIEHFDENTLTKRILLPETGDEVQLLAHSFNRMAEKLNRAFNTQKVFAASAAHELRTPLSILQTKIDVYRKKQAPTPKEQQNLLETFELSIARMSEMTNDLLEITNTRRLEKKEIICLRSLLEDIAESLEPIAQKRGVTLMIEGTDHPLIYGNYNLLGRALNNLVENAIKYNTENGWVRIQIGKLDDQAIITISDNGIGIPTEFHSMIFEPFFRVDPSRSRKQGGNGLGLAIVKNILERHDAKIRIKEGTVGTTFEIQIKAAKN